MKYEVWSMISLSFLCRNIQLSDYDLFFNSNTIYNRMIHVKTLFLKRSTEVRSSDCFLGSRTQLTTMHNFNDQTFFQRNNMYKLYEIFPCTTVFYSIIFCFCASFSQDHETIGFAFYSFFFHTKQKLEIICNVKLTYGTRFLSFFKSKTNYQRVHVCASTHTTFWKRGQKYVVTSRVWTCARKRMWFQVTLLNHSDIVTISWKFEKFKVYILIK